MQSRNLLVAFKLVLFVLLLTAALEHSVAAPAYGESNPKWNESKLSAEQLLHKYGGAADEIGNEQARVLMLDLVNRDRYDLERLGSLKLDDLASQVAQAHAEEMANLRYLGHYDTSGWKAPERYNAAGGTDVVIENVSYWEVENFDVYITPQVVQDFEARWLKSPGHYRAIMTYEANHLGFGIALARHGSSTVVTAVQLFIVDKSDFRLLPGRIRRTGSGAPTIEIKGKLHPSVEFFYAAVGLEPMPQPRTPEYLNDHLAPYETPEPFAGYLEQVAEGRQRLKNLTTYYTFVIDPGSLMVQGNVVLDDGSGSSGLFYVYVFVRDRGGRVFPVMLQTVEVA
jgi:uncharacterized protein YkwD